MAGLPTHPNEIVNALRNSVSASFSGRFGQPPWQKQRQAATHKWWRIGMSTSVQPDQAHEKRNQHIHATREIQLKSKPENLEDEQPWMCCGDSTTFIRLMTSYDVMHCRHKSTFITLMTSCVKYCMHDITFIRLLPSWYNVLYTRCQIYQLMTSWCSDI